MTYQVVVGIDGSDHGDAALRWALAEAEAHQGEVTAVFAWEMPFISNPAAFEKGVLEQQAKNFLVNRVNSVAPAPRVPLRPVVATGDAAEALVLASQDADLLVLGTRGRALILGLALGGVSVRCAAAARCPVTLIKAPGENPGNALHRRDKASEHSVIRRRHTVYASIMMYTI
jgi:nucleotide-binding universal stress UspA family protein